MNRKRMAVTVAAFALVSSFAFAGGEKPDGQKPTKPISFEELQARCLNPGQFEQQHAPQNLTVQCTDVYTSWIAGTPGEIPLEGSRIVSTALFSDKWHVDAKAEAYAIQGKSGSCLRFKEVKTTFTIEQKLSCDEIAGFKGGIGSYCAGILDKGKYENPKLIETVETGNSLDNCPASDGKPGKPYPKPTATATPVSSSYYY